MASSISAPLPTTIALRPRSERLLDQMSPRQIQLMATACGLSVFGGAFLAERIFCADRRSRKRIQVLSNAAVGALAGWAVISATRQARERHKSMAKRMQMIGDLNHHIRNALQSIQLSMHSSQDQRAIRVVDESIARIERVLREVVPAV